MNNGLKTILLVILSIILFANGAFSIKIFLLFNDELPKIIFNLIINLIAFYLGYRILKEKQKTQSSSKILFWVEILIVLTIVWWLKGLYLFASLFYFYLTCLIIKKLIKKDLTFLETKKEVPILTKIISWLIMLISIWGIVYSVGWLFFSKELRSEQCGDLPCAFNVFVIESIVFLLSSFSILTFFILKGKKWAWNTVMAILLLLFLSQIPTYIKYYKHFIFTDALELLVSIIILFFLLIDRKNFWKNAS